MIDPAAGPPESPDPVGHVRGFLANLRALPRTVWALGLVSLFTDAASDMVYPLLPKLLSTMGAGAVALGFMEGIAELLSSAVKVWSGRAADSGRSLKKLVVFGYGIAAIARPFMSIATHAWQVVLFRAFDRLGKGVRGAPRDTLLAESVHASRRGIAFGVHRGMDNMGAVVGGALAFLLLGAFGLPLKTVLLLSLVPGLVSTSVALFAVRDREPRHWPIRSADAAKASRAALPPLPRAVRRLLFTSALFGLGASADSFLMAHLTRLALPLSLIPIAWISLQLAKSVLNAPGGALADRFGARGVLLASFAVYAAVYVAFPFARSPWTFWALLPIYALHYGLGEGAEKALLAGLCPPESRGRAFGLREAFSGAALLPANVGFGFLYMLDPTWAFGASALMAGLATLSLLLLVPAPTETHRDALQH